MNLQITLALRYLSGRKLRTTLTSLAIVFGVLVVFGMNAMLPTFIRSLQANMMAAAGEVDATITHKTGSSFSETTIDQIMAIKGVRAATGSLNRTFNLPPDFLDNDPAIPDRFTALVLSGIEPETSRSVHAYATTEGRFLQADDQDAALISQTLADELGIETGDSLTLPTVAGTLEFSIVGILPSKMELGNEEVLIPLAVAQDAFNMPGQINTIETNFETIEEAGREAILTEIHNQLGPGFEVGALSSGDELFANIEIARTVINLMGILALFMGGFIIFNTFRTIVIERRRDIGILRAVGASQRTILGLIVTESLLQGIIGTAIGLFLGYFLAYGIIALIEPMLNTFLRLDMGSPSITWWNLVMAISLGLISTVIAGLIPAFGASKVTPLEALQSSGTESSPNLIKGRSFWYGVVMIAVALITLFTKNIIFTGLGGILFFVGLLLVAPGLIQPIAGIFARLIEVIFAHQGTGQLASGNLTRQPTRTAVTASATMIGLAVVLMASSIVTSISLGFTEVLRKSLGSDFLLIPPSVMTWSVNVGASPDLAENLRDLDEVEAISTMRFATSEVDGESVSLIGLNPEDFNRVSGLRITKGDPEAAFAELAPGRAVIVNTALASSARLKVGDEINLVTLDGEQTYKVVGIGTDYLNFKIMGLFISHDNISTDFGITEDTLLQINLKNGIERASVEPKIRELIAPYPQFSLMSGAAYIEENKALLETAFLSMYGLLIFLSVPSLIAMLNTLAISVIERTREIGMLRAVGTTRKQVRTLILAEALILAAIGTSFGIAAGLYLGYLGVGALASAGFPLEYLFPTPGLVAAIIAGLAFGALAAVIPSRQAARMDVVAALRYE